MIFPSNPFTAEKIAKITDEHLIETAKSTCRDFGDPEPETDKEALEYLLSWAAGAKDYSAYEWNEGDNLLVDRILEALERVKEGG